MVNQKRRDIFKAGLYTAFMSALPMQSILAGKKNFLKYNREVCNSLDKLVDYKTGEPFRQDGFVIAYFSTPYNAYKAQGFNCESDLIKIYGALGAANTAISQKIEPVIVFSPLEDGEDDTYIAEKYTNPKNVSPMFTGLTTDSAQLAFDMSKDYRSPFSKDRKTGKIIGHSRFAILISPDGELLAKYLPSHFPAMSHDIVRHVREYDADEISHAKGCDL